MCNGFFFLVFDPNTCTPPYRCGLGLSSSFGASLRLGAACFRRRGFGSLFGLRRRGLAHRRRRSLSRRRSGSVGHCERLKQLYDDYLVPVQVLGEDRGYRCCYQLLYIDLSTSAILLCLFLILIYDFAHTDHMHCSQERLTLSVLLSTPQITGHSSTSDVQ